MLYQLKPSGARNDVVPPVVASRSERCNISSVLVQEHVAWLNQHEKNLPTKSHRPQGFEGTTCPKIVLPCERTHDHYRLKLGLDLFACGSTSQSHHVQRLWMTVHIVVVVPNHPCHWKGKYRVHRVSMEALSKKKILAWNVAPLPFCRRCKNWVSNSSVSHPAFAEKGKLFLVEGWEACSKICQAMFPVLVSMPSCPSRGIFYNNRLSETQAGIHEKKLKQKPPNPQAANICRQLPKMLSPAPLRWRQLWSCPPLSV